MTVVLCAPVATSPKALTALLGPPTALVTAPNSSPPPLMSAEPSSPAPSIRYKLGHAMPDGILPVLPARSGAFSCGVSAGTADTTIWLS
ncbi:hypothetical protein [Zoogloea sp.]|uniref:hypothetical protein n=1 Tax=Zoogloea sp. TaxID=49181 RepID=UPI001D2FAACE|nr:hypothetical protein [Zoogloea sp.]MBK6655977.1 hypothetical protein [Zoogloea sp.]